MFTSVIIPTFNGAKKIINLLHALEKQIYKDFETIVVIDGSTDNTHELLTQTNFSLNLQVINRTNGGRSVARNTGANAAKGDLLLFFDDDVRPLENCIAVHIQHHHQFPNSILVGALTFDPVNATTDVLKYKYYIDKIWQRPFTDNELVQVTLRNFAFTTQNLSVPKLLFFQLGGFDERLTDSEDFDLSMQAILHQISIYFNANAFAWHDDYITMDAYIRRQKEYLKSKKYLSELKPQYVSMHPASFSIGKVNFIKKAIGKLFVYNKLWSFVIHSKLFISFVPQAIRFKLYSIIIHISSIKNL